METGIEQEKIFKGATVTVLEAYPRLELEATKTLISYIESQGGAKTDGAVTINISTLTDKAP